MDPQPHRTVPYGFPGDFPMSDDDGDGVPNTEDVCPAETAHPQWDTDQDGCLDDDDGDGVPNIRDVCPTVMAAAQDDVDRDGSNLAFIGSITTVRCGNDRGLCWNR